MARARASLSIVPVIYARGFAFVISSVMVAWRHGENGNDSHRECGKCGVAAAAPVGYVNIMTSS